MRAPQAEVALLGAVMLDPSTFDLVDLHSGQFRDALAQDCWEAVALLRADRKPVDPVTIAEAIPEWREGSRREAMTFLSQCVIDVPTSANAEHYAEIVRRDWVTQQAQNALASILERSRGGELVGDDLVGAALSEMSRIDTEQPSQAVTIGQALVERFAELEEIARARAEGRPVITGLPTGVPKLDELLGGLQPGLVHIVCGRPGMGKSSLGLGIVDACTEAGYGVHEFPLEDVRGKRVDRAVSRLSGVSAELMQQAKLNQAQFQDVQRAALRLKQRRNWLVDDRGGISAEEVVRSVRKHARDNGTCVVLVDYLTLLRRPQHAKSPHEHHTHSINVLADAAKSDEMAYVVVAQLSREVERRPDKRPMLSDLRESGSIEERAKIVLGMYRGAYYGDPKRGVDYDPESPDAVERMRPNQEEWEARAEILVLKNQNGRTGAVRARWHGPTMTIS